MKKDNILPATIKLNPQFKPFTMVSYIDQTKDYVEPLKISSRHQKFMGDSVHDHIQSLSYCIKLDIPLPEAIKDALKECPPPPDGVNEIEQQYSLSHFVRCTFNLIQEYTLPNKALLPDNNIDLGPFTDYCFHFGSLFNINNKDEPIPIFYLVTAFNMLKNIISLRLPDNIHPVCKIISLIIEDVYSELSSIEDIYLVYCDPQVVKLAKEMPDNIYPILQSLAKNQSAPILANTTFEEYPLPFEQMKNRFYTYPEILPNVGVFVYKSTEFSIPGSYVSQLFNMPSFSIRCNLDNLALLKRGTSKQKQRWYKQRLFDNITNFIGLRPMNLILEGDNPVVQTVIDDPLTVFILNMLVDTDNYNTCRYCGALTTNGKNYCNTEHKEKYRRTSPEGQLDNLLRQWTNGYSKQKISNTEKSRLERYGNYLINRGFDYKQEILPRLQKAKKRLLRDGE